jgi:hypothetical protein
MTRQEAIDLLAENARNSYAAMLCGFSNSELRQYLEIEDGLYVERFEDEEDDEEEDEGD